MKRFLYICILEISKIISKLGLIFNLPFLSSLAFLLSLRKLKSKFKNDKKIILIFEKSHGIDDINQIIKLGLDKNLKFFLLSRIHNAIIYEFFKKNNNNHAYLKYINKVFFYFKKIIDLKMIISFNLRYDTERIFQKIDRDLNIKYLVCQKECLFNANVLNNLKNSFLNLGKFTGDQITVYNDQYKEMITSIKFANDDVVSSIGMSRADSCFHAKEKKKKHILFFLIRPKTGLVESKINFSWDSIAEDTLNSTLSFAEKNPDLRFIFKIKIIDERETYKQQKMIKDKNLKNCYMVYGGNSHQLILNSKFIITFNSTAIFEGLASKKKILIPFFKKKYEKYLKEFIIDTSGSKNIFHAEDTNHLKNLLQDLSYNEEKLEYIESVRDNELLKINIGNSDGKSSERLTKVIENLI